MTLMRPKIHRGHAPPYGSVVHDPWPGDLALGFPLWGMLRFDGTAWRACPSGGPSDAG